MDVSYVVFPNIIPQYLCQCLSTIRDHPFDTVKKKVGDASKVSRCIMTNGSVGQPGVRQEGGYKTNHTKLLPSLRLNIELSEVKK